MRHLIIAAGMMGWILGASPVLAATYYVDFDKGADANDGLSAATAWKHAPGDNNVTGNVKAFVPQPGNIFLLKGGVHYRGQIGWGSTYHYGPSSPLVDGTVTQRIVFKGDGWPGLEGQKAIIDGFEPLTGWKKCSSQAACLNNVNWPHIYTTALTNLPVHPTPAMILNMYQGEQPLSAAQFPCSGKALYQTTENFFTVPAASVTTTSITDHRLEGLGGGELVGKYLILYIGADNEIVYRKILAYAGATITFDAASLSTTVDTVYALANVPGSGVFKSPGQFYLDETVNPDGTYTLYVWPFDDKDLLNTAADIRYSVRSYGFGLGAYANNFTIEGFVIRGQACDSNVCRGSAIYKPWTPAMSNVTVRNNEVLQSWGDQGSISLGYISNLIVENNYVHDTGGSGGGIGAAVADNVLIQGNKLERVARTPIFVQILKNSAIVNNIVRDSQGVHSNGISAYTNCDNILIANNEVTNSNIPFTYESASNFIIYGNIFLGDSIYCWKNCATSLIANNLLESVYMASSATTYTVENNIVLQSLTMEGNGTNNLIMQSNPAIDRSLVFANAPRFVTTVADAWKISRLNQNTVYILPELGPLVQAGDSLIFDHDGIVRTVISSIVRLWQGNWRTEIIFTPVIPELKDGGLSLWPNGAVNFVSDFHLKQGSLAVDGGADIASLLPAGVFPQFDFMKDMTGNSRGQGRGWDIGPYEFSSLPTLLKGDVSGDGRVTMYDAALVLKYTVGGPLTTAQQSQADINSDTTVDAADARVIARKALGLVQ
ncbi:MAG: dockerin type I domain-containing protein [Candidatus Omnitrophota bacterium]